MSCAKERTDTNIAVEDHGKTFRLKNPNRRRVVQVEVDGCLITGALERCDWLFAMPESKRVFYVELKGKNIGKAIDQIISTIGYTERDYVGFAKQAFIVSSRTPSASPEIQRGQLKLKKNHKITLEVKSRQMELELP